MLSYIGWTFANIIILFFQLKLSSSFGVQVQFPSLKFLSWMQQNFPSINVNAVDFYEGRQPAESQGGTVWTQDRVWESKSRRDIIHDVFYFFQRQQQQMMMLRSWDVHLRLNRFSRKLGQIGLKLDNSGDFSDQIESQNVLNLIWKKNPRIYPIWDENMTHFVSSLSSLLGAILLVDMLHLYDS